MTPPGDLTSAADRRSLIPGEAYSRRLGTAWYLGKCSTSRHRIGISLHFNWLRLRFFDLRVTKIPLPLPLPDSSAYV